MHLVNKARQHMAVLNVEVVMGPKDIGGYNRSEGTAMLLEVGPAEAQHLLSPSPDVLPTPSTAGLFQMQN
jgi:hypothetical protein